MNILLTFTGFHDPYSKVTLRQHSVTRLLTRDRVHPSLVTTR